MNFKSTISSSSEFTTFFKSAETYCALIEANEANCEIFLDAIRDHLLNLYNSAFALPHINFDFKSIDDYPAIDYNDAKAMILGKLEKRFYWHVFNPMDESDKEPVCGDLVDDLADIYKDLKTSLNLYNSGLKDCKQNAAWQFKFDFENHWGSHCINALYAIHYFLQKY